jgi:glycosyltransferase involved in cell wall biosynthesis
MSAGLPVIASDIPALKEVLGGVLGISPISNLEEGHLPEDITESQPAGLLIPPSDDRAWAEAIQKVLDCDKLRGALSVRARQRAALFSLEKMTDDYESSIPNFSR